MRPHEADLGYLWDMLDATRAVRQFVSGRTFQDYLKDRMMRGAIERNIEIIGEAASKVSAPFQDAHPEIPWRRIVAQRNVLAHEYGEIKHELMWRVATVRVPELIANLEPLTPPDRPETEA
jgi:uncharacterized protein with HEPN domain